MASSASVRDDAQVATPSEAPMVSPSGGATDNVNRTTAAGGAGSAASEKATDALPNALAALNSAWSSWLGSGVVAQKKDQNEQRKETQHSEAGVSGAEAGNKSHSDADWFGGANRMWHTAVRDVGTRLRDAAQQVQQVDGSALEQSVTLLRKQSGRVVEDVQRGVRNIQLSELVEQATTTLRQQGEEAKQMFVDETPQSAPDVVAPWENLPQTELMYGHTLQREMLRLAVDSVYSARRREQLFVELELPDDGDDDDDDGQALQQRASEAMGALHAHSSLRRLRAMLVPARVSEKRFWAAYFFHVLRVRAELVANNGQLPGGDRDGGDDSVGAHGVEDTAAVEDATDVTDALHAAESVEGESAAPAHDDAHDEDDEEFLSWRRGK